MARFIRSGRNPRWGMQNDELMREFGIEGGKWPAEGCKPRQIQGIWVHVLPADHKSLRKTDRHGNPRKSSTHRAIAACPDCGRAMSVGRLHQHKCSARGNASAAGLAVLDGLSPSVTQSERHMLLEWASIAVHTECGDEDQIAAENAFCERFKQLWCTSRERELEWHNWCHRATITERVTWALDKLCIAYDRADFDPDCPSESWLERNPG